MKNTMVVKKTIDKILTRHPTKTILRHINDLINKKPIRFYEENIMNLPRTDGVYLIFKKPFKKGEFIYVGETRTIHGRLTSVKDARMRNGKPTNHSFIKYINETYDEYNETKLRKIVKKNYAFSSIEVESKEMAFVIEGIIQRIYRKQLKNKKRKSIIPV